jgi:hypothetical protein
MFTRLLLGSVLGMTLVAFSPTTSVNAQGFSGTTNGLYFDLQLLGFLESELLIVEEFRLPQVFVSLLQQDIRKDERLIACSLGHCNVSPF